MRRQRTLSTMLSAPKSKANFSSNAPQVTAFVVPVVSLPGVRPACSGTCHRTFVPRIASRRQHYRCVFRAELRSQDRDHASRHPPDPDNEPGSVNPSKSDASSSQPPEMDDEPDAAHNQPRHPVFSQGESSDSDSAVVSASGAFQVDDGSLSETASFVAPRRLRRKQNGNTVVAFAKSDSQPVRAHARGAAVSQPSPIVPRITAFFDRIRPSSKIPTSIVDAVVLGLLFFTWYWSNTAFNIYNKQVLKVFPFPVTCTVVQFLVASVCMGMLWLLRLKEPPNINKFLLRATLPLAVLHAAGFLLTNMSLGKVSVAFTHTVKSTEPFFSVALTPSILGEVPTWGIVISLFPIVAGVALASATEVSFNWIGFLSAVGSNVALQSRNVLSKKLMTSARAGGKVRSKKFSSNAVSSSKEFNTSIGANKLLGAKPTEFGGGHSTPPWLSAQAAIPLPQDSDEDVVVPFSAEEESALRALDNTNLFAAMTMLAFILLAPLSVLSEGLPLAGAFAAQAVTGMPKSVMYRKLVLGGICRCLDVLSSYMILQRVSPVTHSVGNCVKRAVVIAFSIVIFKTQMSALNVAGTGLALLGVFIYSLVISACKQNTFGPDSPMCKPIYETEVELTEGGGI